MLDIFRDSPFGQCLRFLGGNRMAQYQEDEKDGQLLKRYSRTQQHQLSSISSCLSDEEKASEPEHSNSKGAHDDTIIVTWYSEDDPDNPRNWSRTKKGWTSFVLLFYTFTIYIGSSLYAASTEAVAQKFGVSITASSLGLSLYVVGYAIAPLIWSPLSEIPAVGRNTPYIVTFFLFLVLCVPTALVNTFGGLLVLRFLLGFFGSPALATGGASYGDFYSPAQMPYVLVLWGGGATLGPSLGPVVSGFAVQYKDWRWSSWELLWLAGPAFLLMFFSLPETSSDYILLQRARRLRKLTGRKNIQSESEIRQQQMSGPAQIAFDALIKPWEINIKDPAMLFTTVYTALIYGIYYSFFESFPLVYGGVYGWDLGLQGLAFLALLVGLFVAVVCYCSFFYFYGDARMARAEAEKAGSVPPEFRLQPGLVATFCIPIGLFIFAWTSRPRVHWMGSLVGAAVSMLGVFIIVQCMFVYLALAYARYSGSLFAANNFARGTFAAGSILFARPMFARLGVDGGVSLLGGLTLLCSGGLYTLYFYGHRLRERSRFANA